MNDAIDGRARHPGRGGRIHPCPGNAAVESAPAGPLVGPGGLNLAHDLRRPPLHRSAIKAVRPNPAPDTSFVLSGWAGIVITLENR
jgi:hypothetical protein